MALDIKQIPKLNEQSYLVILLTIFVSVLGWYNYSLVTAQQTAILEVVNNNTKAFENLKTATREANKDQLLFLQNMNKEMKDRFDRLEEKLSK